eukprot:TRINITY_DN12314_c0_g1_i4.p1 TRINITY_DN12314_c0_g1~~TRINITY_DN12314_c0_g1_i4.p1  ORF type:complete len:427 (+),score=76.80 TRINITY_DN12314_c0_g1_i4:87-1367(+)
MMTCTLCLLLCSLCSRADDLSTTKSCASPAVSAALIQQRSEMKQATHLASPVPAAHHAVFAAFIQNHGRAYKPDSEEYQRRLVFFSSRLAKADALNSRPGKLWTAGATKLADFSEEEFARLRGWAGRASPTRGNGKASSFGAVALAQVDSLPAESTRWSNLKSLKVRNQGSCGSCWAVTASTVLDAHAEIYNSPQKSFGAQSILDCTPNPHKCGGDGGCQGATVELAMNQVMRRGVLPEDDQVYVGRDMDCKKSLLQVSGLGDHISDSNDLASEGRRDASEGDAGLKVGMTGWERLPENKYAPLLRAVAELGPVGVSVGASAWDLYVGGVFDGCGKDVVINHAVTLVGYGKDQVFGAKYWLIQNSWGPDWGESGHIRLLRSETEEQDYCGTDDQPQEGTACEDGPASVKVCGMCGILYDNVVPHFK